MNKQHWENIYSTKTLQEVSWYQPHPETSLTFLEKLAIPFSAPIIDIGGGDSLLVDHLLALGYEDISVLDISETAIHKAQSRLGTKAAKVHWILSDVTNFEPQRRYDFWHDRATFHFLTHEDEINKYIQVMQQGLSPIGKSVIGTFALNGPTKCSGIEIRQYSETTMAERLKEVFQKIFCIPEQHTTPWKTIQEFIFCSFQLKPYNLSC